MKLYADTADLGEIRRLAPLSYIQGFTTNPTLMRRAGVRDYRTWAHEVLSVVGDKPVSFEVIAEDEDEMVRQGREIASWWPNVYVKVPVPGGDDARVIRALVRSGVRVNVTAVMSLKQALSAGSAFEVGTPSCLSVFAGRVSDAGRNSKRLIRSLVNIFGPNGPTKIIWASTRQAYDVFRADAVGCDIITVSPALLEKLSLVGKNLDEYSHETVQQFYADARAAGYTL